MIDLKIDFENKCLSVVNGDLVLVKDSDEVVQSLRIRLRMALGNWFLDNRIGVDYFGKILKKGAKPEEIQRELRRIIKETQGVEAILSYNQQIIGRKLYVNFTVSTIYGETRTIQDSLSL